MIGEKFGLAATISGHSFSIAAATLAWISRRVDFSSDSYAASRSSACLKA